MRSVVSLGLLLAVPAAAQQAQAPAQPTPYQRAIAAGYKAAMLCSGIFNAGRTREQVEQLELKGIYPEYEPILPTLKAEIDYEMATVEVAFDTALPPRRAEWRQETGCTTRQIGAAELPVRTRWRTPPRPRPADPRPWPMGDAGIAPKPGAALTTAVARAFDLASYGQGSRTTGVVVLRDGQIAAERYAEGFGPFTSNRTWSVAKSIAGTLVGVASKAGEINVFSPAGIPEWRDGGLTDLRQEITVDQLLRMSSGLHSNTAGNRTDAIYFGGTAVTEETTGWHLEAEPGARFRYANNDTLLAIRALRAIVEGEASDGYPSGVGYPRSMLFDRLGMTHTVAETDWRGNYILSSQVWSTARDLARLGQFWLQNGRWEGRELLEANWMEYMTTPAAAQPASGPGYGATLWLFGPKQGLPEGSYAAQGNRGQYVMVIPSERLVVVRRGEDPGPARFDIARFTADVIAAR